MRFKNFLRFIWEDIKDSYQNNKPFWIFIILSLPIVVMSQILRLYKPEVCFTFLKIVAIGILAIGFGRVCIAFYLYLKNKWEMS